MSILTIKCTDCGVEFELSDEEQEFFNTHTGIDGKQMQLPKRCRACRAARKSNPYAGRIITTRPSNGRRVVTNSHTPLVNRKPFAEVLLETVKTSFDKVLAARPDCAPTMVLDTVLDIIKVTTQNRQRLNSENVYQLAIERLEEERALNS